MPTSVASIHGQDAVLILDDDSVQEVEESVAASSAGSGALPRMVYGRGDSDVAPILSLSMLSQRLRGVCQAIFTDLGSQQREATYQRALARDLRLAGVIVHLEAPVELVRYGVRVGGRRADMKLTLPSGEHAIVELKAKCTIARGDREQLQFYIQAMQVKHGYLISFPHDAGFPIPDSSVFVGRSLTYGMAAFRTLESRPARRVDAAVQIEEIIQLDEHAPPVLASPMQEPSPPHVVENEEDEIGSIPAVPAARSVVPTSSVQGVPQVIAFDTGAATLLQPNRRDVWGITKKGRPCKRCLHEQSYCYQHKDQRNISHSALWCSSTTGAPPATRR